MLCPSLCVRYAWYKWVGAKEEPTVHLSPTKTLEPSEPVSWICSWPQEPVCTRQLRGPGTTLHLTSCYLHPQMRGGENAALNEFVMNLWHRKEQKISLLNMTRPLKSGLKDPGPCRLLSGTWNPWFPIWKANKTNWVFREILVLVSSSAFNKMFCNKGGDTVCSCMKTMHKNEKLNSENIFLASMMTFTNLFQLIVLKLIFQLIVLLPNLFH